MFILSLLFSLKAIETDPFSIEKVQQLQLTASEKNWLSEHPSITIALDDQNPPMNFKDSAGRYTGISIDYLKLISKKTGLKINFWGGSWSDALGRAMSHKVDGILNAGIKENRKPYLNFTDAYFQAPTAFVTQKGFPSVDWIQDLDGLKIAVVSGTTRVSVIKLNCPTATIVEVNSPREGMTKLSEGKVDAFYDDLPVVQHIIEKNFLSNLKISLLYYSEAGESRVGLKNKRAALTSIFNKGIKAISIEEHREILKKWFHLTKDTAVQHDLSLTQEEQIWLEKNPTITVATDPHWAPIEFLDKDLQYKGVAMDYLKEIEATLPIKFIFIRGTWQELMEKGKKGDVDIFSSLSITEERKKNFLFTEPYISFPVVVFGNEKARYIRNIEDISNQNVGVVQSYATHDWVKKDYPSFNLQVTASIPDALEKLRQEELSYFVGNIISTGYYIQTGSYPDIKVVGNTPYRFENRIAVQKDMPQLVSILNKTIASISEAKKREIYSNWIKLKYRKEVDYKIFYQLIMGSVLIFFLFIFWNYHLSKRVEKKTAELKLSNKALMESESRFRSLYENIPIGLFRATVEGEIVSVNPAMVEMFGYANASEVLKKTSFDLYVNPNDRRELINHSSGSTFEVSREVELKKADNTAFWGSLHIRLQRNGSNHTSYLDGSVTNITMRKAAEKTLIENEKKYRTLFNSTNDAILILLDDQIVDCNLKALTMFTCSLENIRLKHMYQIHSPFSVEGPYSKSMFEQKVEAALSGEIQFFEWQYNKETGGVFDAEVTLIRMDISAQSYILSIVRDITQRKQGEAEKEKLMEKLNQSQKMEAIGTLAGGIAHDFNNILTAILGYTGFAKDSVAPGSELSSDLTEIEKAGRRAKALVQQILAFSRQSKEPLQPCHIHLNIKEALKLLRSSIPTTIEIRENIDTNCGAVLSDPTQIHQIMMNLGTNAYHAMKESGGVLGVSLREVQIDKDDAASKGLNLTAGDYLQLEVSDTGRGMTKENLSKIFDPYYTTKPKGEGTGMGLSVVHGILKRYGGHISVYSELGKGSTFRIYFPKIKKGADIEPSVAPRAYPRGTEQALIVDDEEMIVNMLSRILTSLGYTVEAKKDSSEALAAFSAQPEAFDFIITDMTMPKLSGVQLIQRIRELRADIPIILCTGFSDLVDRDKAAELGVNKFLMKPIIKRDVAEAIREVLDEGKNQ